MSKSSFKVVLFLFCVYMLQIYKFKCEINCSILFFVESLRENENHGL